MSEHKSDEALAMRRCHTDPTAESPRVSYGGPSSFRVECNSLLCQGILGQAVVSRLPAGHPKGLALTRLPDPQSSPKGCRP